MFKNKKCFIMLLLTALLVLSACGRREDPPGTLPGDSTTPSGAETTPHSTSAKATTTVPPIEDYTFEPTATGIYVTRDGAVKSAEVTSFNNKKYVQVRYDEAGLKAFIEEEIKTYNDNKKSEAVTVESLTVKDGTATLVLNYTSFNYFLEFQGADFGIKYLSLMSPENTLKNYNIKNLVDIEGQSVDVLTALDQKDTKVLILTGKTMVTLNGDVLYVSQGMDVTGKNIVHCEDDVNYSFIIFR